MIRLGMDLGASTVKLAVLHEGTLQKTWSGSHRGALIKTLCQGLKELALSPGQSVLAAVTGQGGTVLQKLCPGTGRMDDIPAIVEGTRLLAPRAGCVIEIGSQGARFITGLQEAVPRFSVNEHCAGGTGSFFEDQMSRLGLAVEDYSELVKQAGSIPRLSGRCAVFAKTDIIHRQQEGVPTPDILLGLCYAMIRNYKATIVKDLPVCRPVAFCGGVTQNQGVTQAIQEVFGLEEEELLLPDDALFAAAIGAALGAKNRLTLGELCAALEQGQQEENRLQPLPPLKLAENTRLHEPPVTGTIPGEGCALGIDIGSTSTDLVLISPEGTLIDFWYLRTAGDPEGAVRKGLGEIHKRYGEIPFLSVGVTGSGRERVGRMLGADAIRDEITAQARAAAFWVPAADTVFEIGGQDSKYISLKEGTVTDFQMNRICAAGTGSFVEEQAVRMGIPLDEFGSLALSSQAPVELGERCTVFIESSIAAAQSLGAEKSDIAAGLCYSIIRNYLHKVVGGKPVGNHIVLQGGAAYNPGIVAAFQSVYGSRITVSPCFSISGAFGAALLALEEAKGKPSSFRGFDFIPSETAPDTRSPEVKRNIAFYRKAGELLLEGYDGTCRSGRPTVGVPFVLVIHKFFPMANAFFKELGFNVLLSDPTNEETIRLSQQYAQGETCYPVKLIYGHMMQLAQKKVDFIFLPAIHTMRHETSQAKYNYGCVYMQTAALSIAKLLHLEQKGIRLLSPVFDLDFGKEAMASAMLAVGKELGFSKPRCMKALLAGAQAVRRHTKLVEKQGAALLSSLAPQDKVLVLITRNYGVSDPILNMGIPELLLERGHKVITLSHLPGHDLDISADYPNLYWPFGQHILSGAKMIAHHPNLYAVYLTNHGCGPDSVLSHLFRQEMGEKPYLQIEVDEHFSKVGVITRIEAVLQSLSHRPTLPLPEGFQLKEVASRPVRMGVRPERGRPLYLPWLGLYTPYLIDYLRKTAGFSVCSLPAPDRAVINLGRAEMSAKEYLPLPAVLGGMIKVLQEQGETVQFLIPSTLGSEADGQYAQTIRAILDRRGHTGAWIAAPVLETLPQTAADIDLLFRALLTGDLLYSLPMPLRLPSRPKAIPSMKELLELANQAASFPAPGRKFGAVGTPMSLTALDEGILDTLEQEGNRILRAPLSEQMLFLWQEEAGNPPMLLERLNGQLAALATALGEHSPFAGDLAELKKTADAALPRFAGGNGRYRYAKAVSFGERCHAVLSLAPRYENTEMILDMRGLQAVCKAPFYPLALDGDWDEAAWVRLRSFLYYCQGQPGHASCP